MPLTIVIPVRNRADIVGRTLASIEAQTYRPLSVILVDNGSTDATRLVLEQWANAARTDDFDVKVIDEPSPGAARARNAGLKAVETDWTMFFDSDDVMLPGHVERAMKCLSKNPKADIIGWDTSIGLAGGDTKRVAFYSTDMIYNNVLHGGFATQRYMARTEIFRKAGGWSERVRVWDDIELGTRLLTMSPLPMMYKVNGSPTVQTFFTPVSITGASWSEKADDLCHDVDMIESLLPPAMRWIANLKRGQIARVCRKEGRPDVAARVNARIAGPRYQRAISRLAAYIPTDLLRPLL